MLLCVFCVFVVYVWLCIAVVFMYVFVGESVWMCYGKCWMMRLDVYVDVCGCVLCVVCFVRVCDCVCSYVFLVRVWSRVCL